MATKKWVKMAVVVASFLIDAVVLDLQQYGYCVYSNVRVTSRHITDSNVKSTVPTVQFTVAGT